MSFVGVALSVSQSLDDELVSSRSDPLFRLVVVLEKYVRDTHDGNRSELAVEERKSHESTVAEFLSLGPVEATTLVSTMSFLPDVDLLSHAHLGPSIVRYAEEEARVGAQLIRLTKLEVVARVVYVDAECAGIREVMAPEVPDIVTYRYRNRSGSTRVSSFVELKRWWSRGEREGCAVCLEEFESGETVARTPCRHVFHRHCIVNWMHQQGSCPLCRYSHE